MKKPEIYHNEKIRLKELNSFSILDTLPAKDYDNITALAAEICGTPISLISLIDDRRQWFKSHHGLGVSETPKEYAFCAHAINDPKNIFIVEDARLDSRFYDNPLVTGNPHVIFYAGVPLNSDNGMPLGTLCVIDHKPKILNESQLRSLSALSNQVMSLLNLRRNKALLEKALIDLEEKNNEIERFAFIAAHDLKSPLIGVSSMTKLFSEEYGVQIDAEGQNMLNLIESSTDKLRKMIDGLLEYSRSERLLKDEKATINLDTLKKDMANLYAFENDLALSLTTEIDVIKTNRTAIEQILVNLIANAIKYNDKDVIKINIEVKECDNYYHFLVSDNGPGIAKNNQEKIFKIFEIIAPEDKFGQTGNGIGLATVKKTVEKSGGSIQVESDIGLGATFSFSMEK